MKWYKRFIYAYPFVTLILFLSEYYGGNSRGFSLYIGLGAILFPGSFVGLPISESVAKGAGWPTGSPSHVWFAFVLSLITNVVLLIGLYFQSKAKKIK